MERTSCQETCSKSVVWRKLQLQRPCCRRPACLERRQREQAGDWGGCGGGWEVVTVWTWIIIQHEVDESRGPWKKQWHNLRFHKSLWLPCELNKKDEIRQMQREGSHCAAVAHLMGAGGSYEGWSRGMEEVGRVQVLFKESWQYLLLGRVRIL